MKSVLLIGQSNMAGRGFLNEVQQFYNERISVLRNGRWQMMTDPIHFDRAVSGVGPASSFAQAWCKDNKNDNVGLIPCAEGGSSLDDWRIDGILFRHAISEAKFAMESSEIIAVLWHQGESDSHSGLHKKYYEKLDIIFKEFRKQLDLDDVPFIIGGLGDYLGKLGFGLNCTEYDLVNKELIRYSKNNKNCYFVTGEGLNPNLDGIHIDAKSQRRFGIRYYEAFVKRINVFEPINNEEDRVRELYDVKHTMGEKIYMELEKFALGKISYEELLRSMK